VKKRLAAWVGLCLAFGAAGIACPTRELTVDVTDRGISVLGLACRSYAAGCALIKSRIACDADLTCQWDLAENGCRIAGQCARAGNPEFAVDAVKAIQVLLIGRNPVELKAKSRCVVVAGSPEPACLDPVGEARTKCAAKAMNLAIDKAIRGGLTYSGFGDKTEASPVIAIYQPASLPPACEVEELVSCAGLSVPVNEETYDITCASCQDGLRFSVGVDTGPCPVVDGDCFFAACAAALAETKKQPD
jgi:hypothetical protein